MKKLYKFLFRKRIPGRARLTRMLGMDGIFYEVHGFDMFVDPYDYVDAQVLEHGYYETHVFDCIKDMLSENDIFCDVGANVGLHSF